MPKAVREVQVRVLLERAHEPTADFATTSGTVEPRWDRHLVPARPHARVLLVEGLDDLQPVLAAEVAHRLSRRRTPAPTAVRAGRLPGGCV